MCIMGSKIYFILLVSFIQINTIYSLDNIIYGGEIKLQSETEEYVVKTSPPVIDGELPIDWDWRKKGLLTTDLNQHIPQYWLI